MDSWKIFLVLCFCCALIEAHLKSKRDVHHRIIVKTHPRRGRNHHRPRYARGHPHPSGGPAHRHGPHRPPKQPPRVVHHYDDDDTEDAAASYEVNSLESSENYSKYQDLRATTRTPPRKSRKQQHSRKNKFDDEFENESRFSDPAWTPLFDSESSIFTQQQQQQYQNSQPVHNKKKKHRNHPFKVHKSHDYGSNFAQPQHDSEGTTRYPASNQLLYPPLYDSSADFSGSYTNYNPKVLNLVSTPILPHHVDVGNSHHQFAIHAQPTSQDSSGAEDQAPIGEIRPPIPEHHDHNDVNHESQRPNGSSTKDGRRGRGRSRFRSNN